jgi:hypothetical protein
MAHKGSKVSFKTMPDTRIAKAKAPYMKTISMNHTGCLSSAINTQKIVATPNPEAMDMPRTLNIYLIMRFIVLCMCPLLIRNSTVLIERKSAWQM